ncbi:MAG: DUF2095 domain-containing protein [Euryarchaeota archaeon]|nr:DUF2095 domain-containing protein [Euryarchaeota archaeon]
MKDFRRRYPNLAKELEGEGLRIDSVRSSPKEAERAVHDRYRGYDPTVIDFLRRCDTEEQGLEIIAYMQGRGEIGEDYARKLKFQLIKDGIRSFGRKKEYGYYLKRC